MTIDEVVSLLNLQKDKYIELESKINSLEEKIDEKLKSVDGKFEKQSNDIVELRIVTSETKTQLVLIKESTTKLESLLEKMINAQESRIQLIFKYSIFLSGVAIFGKEAIPTLGKLLGF